VAGLEGFAFDLLQAANRSYNEGKDVQDVSQAMAEELGGFVEHVVSVRQSIGGTTHPLENLTSEDDVEPLGDLEEDMMLTDGVREMIPDIPLGYVATPTGSQGLSQPLSQDGGQLLSQRSDRTDLSEALSEIFRAVRV